MKKFCLLLLLVDFAHAAGGPGNALYFIDSFDSVSVPHTNALNAYPFTVTAWFQTEFVGGPEPVALIRKFDGAFNGWRIQMFNERLYASYFASGTSYVWDGGFGLDIGFVGDHSWHHLAFTVDASGGKVYLDGVLTGSRAWTGAPAAATTTQNLILCGSEPPNPTDLRLDEVTIWNVALSQAQIQANKNRSLTGNESGLVAYYRCDESAGSTTLRDSAPAGGFNHGSLAAFAVLFEPSDVFPFTPFAQTLAATAVGATNATLNGVANPAYTNTSAWFEWGTTTNYGNATAPQLVGSGVGNVNFSRVLTGLGGGGTYHFRAVASNSLGMAVGTNQSFTLPLFANINGGFPGPTNANNYFSLRSAAWGDYDGDGRLDVALSATNRVTTLWRNGGGGFSNSHKLFTYAGPVSWTDFNNDGWLDLARSTDVARNTGAGFDLVPIPFVPVAGYDLGGQTIFGDYDGNGTLDALFTGLLYPQSGTDYRFATRLARNDGMTFEEVSTPFTPAEGPAAWADFNGDGRIDVALTGATNLSSSVPVPQLWQNTMNGFSNMQTGLPGVAPASVAWGDFNNDGRIDITLTGDGVSGALSQIWTNGGTGFTQLPAGLPGVLLRSAEWGDYDNDGRSDLLLVGKTNFLNQPGGAICQLWRNTGPGFALVTNAGLPGLCAGNAVWGDYDNDGRLDILFVGFTNWHVGVPQTTRYPLGGMSQIWRNLTPVTNTPPNVPTGLSISISGLTATFRWNASTDAQTPTAGLTYNLRVGTTPGGSEIVSAMSIASGRRQLPAPGNAGARLERPISSLPVGTPIYWSVQAVDNGFAASPFAQERTFTMNTVLTPSNGVAVAGDSNGDGFVTQAELDTVLANYFPTSPWLQITNVAGLGGTNVTFALTNSLTGAFSVEYTTDLLNWLFLGPATPRYEFTDTNAPALPQRYYRLRWP